MGDEMRFRTQWRVEADDWIADGSKITAAETLDAIRRELDRGPVIVEHWYYRGATPPSRHVFDDYEAFTAYLRAEASAGDAVDVWSWSSACIPERRLVEGKCPAEDGTIPRHGAY